MGSKLPKNWVKTKLGTVTSKPQYGWTTKSSATGTLRYIRTTDLSKGNIDWDNVPYCEKEPDDISKYIIETGDILISRAGSIGLSYLIGHIPYDAIFASYLIRFKPLINSRVIAYYLRTADYWHEITNASAGIAVQNVNAVKLANLTFPLPPAAEQERIAEKLDSLFEQYDALKTSLDRIPQMLKNFRQQVLSMSVMGKHTSEGFNITHVLGREEKSLENIADIIDPHPSHRTPPFFDGGIPYIGIGDICNGHEIDFENARKISPRIWEEHKERYTIKKGDFIFGKIGTIGNPVRLPAQKDYCLSANVILIQPNKFIVDPSFLYFYLCSIDFMKDVTSKVSSTSQPAFGIKKMRNLTIHIPSLEEQKKIVQRVESLFKKADKIEQQYKVLKIKIEKLPQAILHKAFKGELVEQLPTDGDAADLLKQIEELKNKLPKPPKRNE